jgi:hypothetical protein
MGIGWALWRASAWGLSRALEQGIWRANAWAIALGSAKRNASAGMTAHVKEAEWEKVWGIQRALLKASALDDVSANAQANPWAVWRANALEFASVNALGYVWAIWKVNVQESAWALLRTLDWAPWRANL